MIVSSTNYHKNLLSCLLSTTFHYFSPLSPEQNNHFKIYQLPFLFDIITHQQLPIIDTKTQIWERSTRLSYFLCISALAQLGCRSTDFLIIPQEQTLSSHRWFDQVPFLLGMPWVFKWMSPTPSRLHSRYTSPTENFSCHPM